MQHAAHQQGINHDSPVGAVLYAEDLDSIFEGNMTIANSTADAGMMQNGEHEDDLTVHHATQSEVSSRAASRRELPARTHHHQTVENP